VAVATAAVAAFAALTLPASAAPASGYDVPEPGVYLEGIGVDQRAGVFYVSATNRSGTIYRGMPGSPALEVFVGPGAGDDGRGIDVDRDGNVYVAGGPSGQVRVYSRAGTLLAELPAGAPGAYLNDVWVGPDGAAYVTDSSLPVIRRVSHRGGAWTIEDWLDVRSTIPYTAPLADFDLNGIVATVDRRHLLAVQSSTGRLWRIDLATRAVDEVETDGSPLTNGDGLVLRGTTLTVVQNFSRQVTTLRTDDGWDTARVVGVTPTDPARTFTTAKYVRGQILGVDSQFGFAAPPAQDRVVPLP
jgi:Cu-Zn family superoxide dismutase